MPLKAYYHTINHMTHHILNLHYFILEQYCSGKCNVWHRDAVFVLLIISSEQKILAIIGYINMGTLLLCHPFTPTLPPHEAHTRTLNSQSHCPPKPPTACRPYRPPACSHTPYPKRFKCDYLPTAEFYTYMSTICHIYEDIYVVIYVTYMSSLNTQ